MLRFLLSTAVLAAAAVPAAAQDLYVGSSNTSFMRGDPVSGGFLTLGACGGSIQSMDEDLGHVWLGDVGGRIYHYEPELGFPGYAFDSPNDATALLVRGGALWIGGSDGTVHELDRRDGAVLRSFDAGVPIAAMVLHEGYLYAGSTFGVVMRMSEDGGAFSFWGTCGGPVNSIAADDTHLIVGDTNGTVYRIALATQSVDGSFPAGNDATAMVVHEGALLVSGTDGDVRRLDRVTGATLAVLDVQPGLAAMVLEGVQEPGAPYCYGIGCPCGNDDVLGGCANHLGAGATMHASGTDSVGADDLVIATTSLPQGGWGIPYMSSVSGQIPFGDGFLCTGAGYPTFRFGARNAGPARTITLGPGLVDHSQRHFAPGGRIQAGSTWVFQIWYRNANGPCGNGFNTSNAYVVTFGL